MIPSWKENAKNDIRRWRNCGGRGRGGEERNPVDNVIARGVVVFWGSDVMLSIDTRERLEVELIK